MTYRRAVPRRRPPRRHAGATSTSSRAPTRPAAEPAATDVVVRRRRGRKGRNFKADTAALSLDRPATGAAGESTALQVVYGRQHQPWLGSTTWPTAWTQDCRVHGDGALGAGRGAARPAPAVPDNRALVRSTAACDHLSYVRAGVPGRRSWPTTRRRSATRRWRSCRRGSPSRRPPCAPRCSARRRPASPEPTPDAAESATRARADRPQHTVADEADRRSRTVGPQMTPQGGIRARQARCGVRAGRPAGTAWPRPGR